MIVSSFTPSYSTLAYLSQFLGTVFIHLIVYKIYYLFFPAHFPLSQKCCHLSNKIFSSFQPLEVIT